MQPILPENKAAIVDDGLRPITKSPAVVGLRIGAVSYLNSKPLLFGLSEAIHARDRLSLAVPSKLASELSAGTLDIGLIPVIEYFSNPEYRLVSNAAIACCGPVWSVRVFFRSSPDQVQCIAMDEGSRTSVALTKVLFQQRFGFVPQTVNLPLHQDPRNVNADAVLVIGDRAMHPELYRPAFQQDWDLGQAWLEETGLPFVFAAWVARDSRFAATNMADLFEQIRDEGTNHVDDIAQQHAGSYGLTTEQCKDYLTNFIRFRLGERERAGLEEFRRRCDALGLTQH
jgi:chorismate dehydratase